MRLSYNQALSDYQQAYQTMRQSILIDYAQLGLDYTLTMGAIIFNQGVCYAKLGDLEKSTRCIKDAIQFSHDYPELMYGDALELGMLDMIPFHVPLNRIFRPNQTKVNNLEKKEFLEKSRVVAELDDRDIRKGATLPKEWAPKGINMGILPSELANLSLDANSNGTAPGVLRRTNTTIDKPSHKISEPLHRKLSDQKLQISTAYPELSQRENLNTLSVSRPATSLRSTTASPSLMRQPSDLGNQVVHLLFYIQCC